MVSRLWHAAVLSVIFAMSMPGNEAIAQLERGAPMIPGANVQFLPDGNMTDRKIAVYGDLVRVKYRAVAAPPCLRNVEILRGIYKGVTVYKIRMHDQKRLVYSTFVPRCASGSSSGN